MNIDTIHTDYTMLRLQARELNDLMQTRIRSTNRFGAYQRAGGGEVFSMGDALVETEKIVVKALEKRMRSIVGPHMQAFLETPGIGDKTLARLLGEIGHPVIAFPAHWAERPDAKGTVADPKRVLVQDEPFERMVSQLWTYCGYGDAKNQRRKGMTQEEAFLCGNPRAKSLVYLMSSNCMKRTGEPDKNGVAKARSPYRNVYEETKAHYETVRPEWTPGHRNSAALRKCSKEILKDLWIAAKADLAEDTGEVLLAA